MKRSIPFLLFVCMLCVTEAKGTGFGSRTLACNLGNDLYPIATGGVNATGHPTYYNSAPIRIRWWDEDPNCGIRSNKISMRSNTQDFCEVLGVNWGIVYYINKADNSCVQLPLDELTWLALLIAALGGGILIRNKMSHSEVN